MNSLFTYLIESNICLLLFGLLYVVFFKNETDFKFRRYYILSAVIIAVMAPLFKLGSFYTSSATELSELPTLILPELKIGESTTSSNLILEYSTTWNTLKIIYSAIALLLLQYFLFQMMQVFWFAFSNKKRIKKTNGILWINTNGTLPTFSFFNILFFDNSVSLSDVEKERIISHELAHVHQKHSLDIILLECIKIVSWFNPITWYLRTEIQDLHEYLADQKASTNNNTDDYTSLLAKLALNQANLSIGHHFNKSKTLKRIEMMKTIKQEVKNWKLALTIPLLIGMAMIVSCNDEIAQDVNTVMQTASQVELPTALETDMADLQRRYPNADFVYMEADGNSKDAIANLKDIDPMSIALVRNYEDQNKVGFIVNKNGPIQNKPDINGVYTIVDEGSTPEGGINAFFQRISENLQYPAQAQKLGVEGKVYIQFVVNESGIVEDITTLKGIGAGCDIAAREAVAKSGNWSVPMVDGKPVKQRIILPITFALDDEEEVKDEIKN